MRFTSIAVCAVVCCMVSPVSASAELTNVRVTSRAVVANGQAFGLTGPYEKLVGRVEFALDPADPRNKSIVARDRHRPASSASRRRSRASFDDFRQSYVLRYAPTGVKGPGWHAIAVAVPAAKNATIRARQGYYGGT